MEIPIIPKNVAESAKTNAVSGAKAYKAGAARKAESDAVQISSKSKLMQKLRTTYSELEKKDEEKVREIREKLDGSPLEMSSEEIVTNILKGTMFDVI